MVYEWLNPVYLKPDVQEQIREKFEADSEIELQGFLKVVTSELQISLLQLLMLHKIISDLL